MQTVSNTKKIKKKQKKNTHTHTHTAQDKSNNCGLDQQLIYLIY